MRLFKISFLILISCLLTSCITSLFSGAQLVYERQAISKEINNHQIYIKANHALFDHYRSLRQANISVVAYNYDLVVVGQVARSDDKKLVSKILKKIKGVRRVFNELTIGENTSISKAISDSWLTSKIRAKMVAENGLDPSQFKIISEKGAVYILGDVKKDQAQKVIEIVRRTSGVKKVIKILRYYNYTDIA
jgi:osmotically-inducible protein OsmY